MKHIRSVFLAVSLYKDEAFLILFQSSQKAFNQSSVLWLYSALNDPVTDTNSVLA
jgi:hypothetical protein